MIQTEILDILESIFEYLNPTKNGNYIRLRFKSRSNIQIFNSKQDYVLSETRLCAIRQTKTYKFYFMFFIFRKN